MENNNSLNRVFTLTSLFGFLGNKREPAYECLLEDRSLINLDSNREALASMYRLMADECRNEYFYKNTLLNQLVLSKHKLGSAKVFSEFSIGNAIADFVIINGKAVVYEIKTELDSLERIDRQVEEYYRCFPFVCIVTCEKHLKKVQEKFAKSDVGIYLFTRRNRIKTIKESCKNTSRLDKKALFSLLRKSEWEQILRHNGIRLPEVAPVKYYDESLRLFLTLKEETILRCVMNALKQRDQIDLVRYEEVPFELKMLVYQARLNACEYDDLFRFLDSPCLRKEEPTCVFSLFKRPAI